MKVKDQSALGKHLIASVKSALKSRQAGRTVRPVTDVYAVRKQLGMTQKQFADSYGIGLKTLRNWEQEKKLPDSAILAYLVCIAHHPKQILKFLRQAKYPA